jgi:hypothetical protein
MHSFPLSIFSHTLLNARKMKKKLSIARTDTRKMIGEDQRGMEFGSLEHMVQEE